MGEPKKGFKTEDYDEVLFNAFPQYLRTNIPQCFEDCQEQYLELLYFLHAYQDFPTDVCVDTYGLKLITRTRYCDEYHSLRAARVKVFESLGDKAMAVVADEPIDGSEWHDIFPDKSRQFKFFRSRLTQALSWKTWARWKLGISRA